jgi:ribose 1,5-bisphosphokinase PhnN
MTLAIHLTNKPVTLPMQAGLKMKFRAPGLIYIRNFNITQEIQKGTTVIVSS